MISLPPYQNLLQKQIVVVNFICRKLLKNDCRRFVIVFSFKQNILSFFIQTDRLKYNTKLSLEIKELLYLRCSPKFRYKMTEKGGNYRLKN